jgi:RNA polymerase primary sigma factor
MRQLVITNSITLRESRSLEKYLQEISKLKMISIDEEIYLTGLIKTGDQRGINRLVQANLKFVVSVAKKYQNQGLPLTGLINEGNIGLIEAAKRFDETRGFKFISYAVWWIRQSILTAIAEHAKLVRLPINKVALVRKIKNGFQLLEQELEREPTVEELAELSGIEKEDVILALSANRHTSLDTPLSEGGENTLLDITEDPNAEKTDEELDHAESLSVEVSRFLKTLSPKQRLVICYFFGIGIDYPLSLDHIGQKLKITRERVRQIKEKAIAELRAKKQTFLLKNFLGS